MNIGATHMLVNARPLEYCCNLCSIPDSSVFRSSGPSIEIASCWYLTASAKLPIAAAAAATAHTWAAILAGHQRVGGLVASDVVEALPRVFVDPF